MMPQFAALSSREMERNFSPKMKPLVSSSGMLSVSVLLECQYSTHRIAGEKLSFEDKIVVAECSSVCI